jgi:hypothetical protein
MNLPFQPVFQNGQLINAYLFTEEQRLGILFAAWFGIDIWAALDDAGKGEKHE